MNKIAVGTFTLSLILTLSGCSLLSKKEEVNIDNLINRKEVTQETSTPTGSNRTISTSTELINTPQPIFTRENDLESKIFQCSDAPVKFSDLKAGDIFNSYKIAKIYYNKKFINGDSEGVLNPYSGHIEFEGEQKITGSLLISKTDGEGSVGIYFLPDDLMPNFDYNNWKDDGEESVKGLVCGKESFFLNMEIKNHDENFTNLNEFDFPLISKKIPDFKNFWIQAKDGDIYPKKVIIKVKNINSGFIVGGSGGNSNDLVEVVKVLD